jgi:tetratricopeptide (TPR) repeat protein
MPANVDAYEKALNEGHSAAWDQDWTKAAACYRRALQEMPDQPNALNNLGLALYQMGDFDEALKIYEQVARLSANDPVPLEKVAELSERLGNINAALDAAMKAAEAFLRQRDIVKAVENWSRVTALQPDHALAHSRLATAYERLGRQQQAVTEYLAVASILQHAGNPAKAREVVSKALELVPESPEAREAETLLKSGQTLPQPMRPKGGTGPLRMAKIKKMQEAKDDAQARLDPVAEASQKALSKLAEILFDYTDETPAGQERRGLNAIVKGTGQLSMQHAEQTKVVVHLGQAIDAQTKGEDAMAADELERALDAGFDHAALHFDLGNLRLKGDRQESAIRHLAHAVNHREYGLGARLLMGEMLYKKGLFKDASVEYLQALKFADSMTVPEDQADDIREMYEPFVEAHQAQKDEDICRHLCDNIRGLLMRADWRDQIHQTRQQLQKEERAAPLAEVMLQAQGSGVVESVNRIHELARMGSMRSAMDEAYSAVQRAPAYLPLHNLMADLLIEDGRTQDAIAKLSVVAHAYAVRGETAQATKLWRRIIQLAPMDMSARSSLIDLLVTRGQVDDAISEYLELAEIYYHLAELDMARKTYTTALRLVQQTNANRDWNVQILQHMADIDMQRLDWKQAVRVYEQIRTLRPDDQGARAQLIELFARLGQPQQAAAELDSFVGYLESAGKSADGVPFLEALVEEHGDQLIYQRALAEQLHRVGRTQEAVNKLDALGESLLQGGNKRGAVEVITQIVGMNPPNAEDYRKLLTQIAQQPST